MNIIGGKFKGRKLSSPKGDNTRPTSNMLRQRLFNICQQYIENALFLDLFAGSGAVAFEAISRGAANATCVDNNREAIRCIQHNIETLGIKDQTRILFGNVFIMLNKLETLSQHYDIIFADPPYHSTDGREVVKIIDASHLLKPGGRLFIEEASDIEENEEPLKTLELKSTRRSGRSVLKEYLK